MSMVCPLAGISVHGWDSMVKGVILQRAWKTNTFLHSLTVYGSCTSKLPQRK